MPSNILPLRICYPETIEICFRRLVKLKSNLIELFPRINAQINKVREPQQTGREAGVDGLEAEIAALQPKYHMYKQLTQV